MQDRLMNEIADLGADTTEKRDQFDERIADLKLEHQRMSEFADNREGRRAAQRALRKRNGYTR